DRGLHSLDIDRAVHAGTRHAVRIRLLLSRGIGAEEDMTMERRRRQRGTAFAYIGFSLFALVGFTGLAVDLGRGYVVKSHLSKAVDAAALAAARRIGEGEAAATAEAVKIFNANFPSGFLGV